MNQVRRVGRNDRCPCGSGKKYKGCCLRAHEAQGLTCLEPFTFSCEAVQPVGAAPPETQEARARRARRDEEDRLTFGSPFAKARQLAAAAEGLVDDPVRRAQWRLRTPASVAAMSTEELQELLEGLGFDGSREGLTERAGRHRSAFALADGWGARGAPKHLAVFAGLAAHELWKRFCPERPSTERFEELVEEGYERFLRRDTVGACERWAKARGLLRGWLEPGQRTTAAAERALGIGAGLARWASVFGLALTHLALEDSAWKARALEVLDWFIDQFPDEDDARPRRGRAAGPGVRAELVSHREVLRRCLDPE